jgi:8-oxo-dGTP pyrophosphatase MutT (NUDIX family)
VALIFRAGGTGAPELLFIKRADYPGDPWSGQVAFPGGREEQGDSSLLETAVRETREETGIDLVRDGTVIGTLDDLRPRTVRLPAVIVRPFVAALDDPGELLLSPEVALAFWIPLEALRRAESWRETSVYARGVQINARGFQHEGHVVWGMTERILAQLLALIE